mmetsp:Transcript_3740/g.8235  ORF Transcript_3740/g.8235 Transcript_3740/m.8235 type:complete len:387 (-) Transcript_3740:689-1849(-)
MMRPFSSVTALVASSGCEKHTNPNPRELLFSSSMILHDVIVPCAPNASRSLSSSTSSLRFFTNKFTPWNFWMRSIFICSYFARNSVSRSDFFCALPAYRVSPSISFPFISATAFAAASPVAKFTNAYPFGPLVLLPLRDSFCSVSLSSSAPSVFAASPSFSFSAPSEVSPLAASPPLASPAAAADELSSLAATVCSRSSASSASSSSAPRPSFLAETYTLVISPKTPNNSRIFSSDVIACARFFTNTFVNALVTSPVASRSFFDLNGATEIGLPAMSFPFSSLIAFSAASAISKCTNPYPRDSPTSFVCTLQLMMFPYAENVSYSVLLSTLLSKFFTNKFPCPYLRIDGSRCFHISRSGRPFVAGLAKKFIVSSARSASIIELKFT